jgi:hypothetical protein
VFLCKAGPQVGWQIDRGAGPGVRRKIISRRSRRGVSAFSDWFGRKIGAEI